MRVVAKEALKANSRNGIAACSLAAFRELSNGHFSEDNQKRLNGPDTEIPIFEAKTTRDSRLVVRHLSCKLRVLS